jgi:hypothetical protein
LIVSRLTLLIQTTLPEQICVLRTYSFHISMSVPQILPTYSFFAAPANNSSASLFFVPLTSLSPNFAFSPLSPALTLALAAPFKRSESSFRKSSVLLAVVVS